MKITILDSYSCNPGDINWDVLAQMGTVTTYDRTSPADVVSRCADSEIILTNKVVMSAEVMSQLPKLRYIGVLATGYNIIDTAYAHEHNIIVTNIPAYSTDSVAQMVFAHLLNVTNEVAHYADACHEKRWSNSKDFCFWDSPIHELTGKNFAICGLGNIGRRVAEIAHAFGMRVISDTSKDASIIPDYVTKVTRDELLATADVISLHCPLTETTKEMINAEAISKMRKGVILINTGRGPLINEQDVVDGIQNGQLGAYCADVVNVEPCPASSPLIGQPNVFLTPHIAWASVEARKRLRDIAIDNVCKFIAGTPINMV